MVKSAVADIICPTVTAENPLALLGQVVFKLQNLLDSRLICALAVLERLNQLLGGSRVRLAVVFGVKVIVDNLRSLLMTHKSPDILRSE